MDPNATVQRMREIAHKVMYEEIDIDDASEMAQLFLALDHWLKTGGFTPEDWM